MPIIEKTGTNAKGGSEYQVIVYKRGVPHRIDNGLGVGRVVAEKIKKEYIQKQIQKNQSETDGSTD